MVRKKLIVYVKLGLITISQLSHSSINLLAYVYMTQKQYADASIGFYKDASGANYPYVKKYLHAHLNFNNTDDNWPVYRYSDVLLLLAEALNEQSKSTEALTYLNQVRDRAFGAGKATINVTAQGH